MTILDPGYSRQLKLFKSYPHPCPYLPGREATNLFVDTREQVAGIALYSELSEQGFRRSGPYLYRPHCAGCSACIPMRIPVQEFSYRRRHRRLLRKNADLTVTRLETLEDDTYFRIYERYIQARHADGNMYPATREQYENFFWSRWRATSYYVFHKQGKPVLVSVTDHMEHGLAAVYSFYEPVYARLGLGNFAILWQIDEARRLGLESLYLGYWIRGCRKMDYKSQYTPIELLLGGKWVRMTDDDQTSIRAAENAGMATINAG